MSRFSVWKRLVITAVLVTGVPSAARAQGSLGYVDWLNRRIDEAVTARLNQRGTAKQAEAPSTAASSTTLVDHASFADALGISFNPAVFPRREDGEAEATSQSFSLTPYAILAALRGTSPTDPFLYEESRAWRRLSISVGFEDEDGGDGAPNAGRTLLTALKLKLWSPREVDPGDPRIGPLRGQLGLAAGSIAALDGEIQDTLISRLTVPLGLATSMSQTQRAQFINRLANPQVFQAYLALLGEEGQRVILELIEDHVDAAVGLRQQTRQLVAELRGQPQLSLDVQSRTRATGGDEIVLGLALDLGLTDQLHWTLNGGAKFVGEADSISSAEGANVATELAFQLRPPSMAGPDPIALGIAVEGEVFDGRKPIWKVQGRLTIPVLEGISFPVTATWSNRSELVDDDDLFGRVALAIDTSRFLLALSKP